MLIGLKAPEYFRGFFVVYMVKSGIFVLLTVFRLAVR